MPFSTQPVVVGDAEALASTMMSAWYSDPQWQNLWHEPSLERIIAECALRLPWNLVNGRYDKRHQKAVQTEAGAIVGYARWILPPSLASAAWLEARTAEPELEERKEFEKKFWGNCEDGRWRGLRHDVAAFRSRPLEDTNAEIMKDGPYMMLDYLTIAPSYQRRGIASMLLGNGLRIADKNGLKSYIMSSPAALKLYLTHGFVLMKTVETDYSQHGGTEPDVQHFLLRQPKAVPGLAIQ